MFDDNAQEPQWLHPTLCEPFEYESNWTNINSYDDDNNMLVDPSSNSFEFHQSSPVNIPGSVSDYSPDFVPYPDYYLFDNDSSIATPNDDLVVSPHSLFAPPQLGLPASAPSRTSLWDTPAPSWDRPMSFSGAIEHLAHPQASVTAPTPASLLQALNFPPSPPLQTTPSPAPATVYQTSMTAPSGLTIRLRGPQQPQQLEPFASHTSERSMSTSTLNTLNQSRAPSLRARTMSFGDVSSNRGSMDPRDIKSEPEEEDDDHMATVTARKKKRSSFAAAGGPDPRGYRTRTISDATSVSASASGGESPLPLKSELRPPKLAPSTWQLYFTDWIQRHQANSDRKLNVAQAAKEAGIEYASLTEEQKEPFRRRSQEAKMARAAEVAAWHRTLTPKDIRRENAYRTAQRRAGRSRRGNIKDPNAPKKPLSAYFMFLHWIRSDGRLVREVFGDEKETTSQSVLAAKRWREMTDEERKPFLAQAEKEKLEYEAARRMYEDGSPGIETTISFGVPEPNASVFGVGVGGLSMSAPSSFSSTNVIRFESTSVSPPAASPISLSSPSSDATSSLGITYGYDFDQAQQQQTSQQQFFVADGDDTGSGMIVSPRMGAMTVLQNSAEKFATVKPGRGLRAKRNNVGPIGVRTRAAASRKTRAVSESSEGAGSVGAESCGDGDI